MACGSDKCPGCNPSVRVDDPDTPTTPAPLTAAERAAIRARAEAATPGPWRATDAKPWSPKQRSPEYGASILSDEREVEIVSGGRDDCYGVGEAYGVLLNEDAQFIAHARTDIPRLLDALDAAEIDRHDLRAQLEDAESEARAERERRERAEALFSTCEADKAQAREIVAALRGDFEQLERERDAARAQVAALRRGCLTSGGQSCRLCLGSWIAEDGERVTDHHDGCPVGAALAAAPTAHACREPALREALELIVGNVDANGKVRRGLGWEFALSVRKARAALAGGADGEATEAI